MWKRDSLSSEPQKSMNFCGGGFGESIGDTSRISFQTWVCGSWVSYESVSSWWLSFSPALKKLHVQSQAWSHAKRASARALQVTHCTLEGNWGQLVSQQQRQPDFPVWTPRRHSDRVSPHRALGSRYVGRSSDMGSNSGFATAWLCHIEM